MQVKNFKINLYVAHKTINNPQNFVYAIYIPFINLSNKF